MSNGGTLDLFYSREATMNYSYESVTSVSR